MKRVGNLYDQIADPDNLRLAYYKAKRGKEAKADVIRYAKHLRENIYLLNNQLHFSTVEPGDYHFFTIFEPKERLICAASFTERVLHHAIMNVCHPYFEKYQIDHSFATRLGKGQYAALEIAKANQSKNLWFCKLDIKKYFDSVSHEILIKLLHSRFKDQRLLYLFEKIIRSYQITKSHGLPIGNLTSQYFANFYLAVADHHLLEKIKIPSYVRYMDDMVLWHQNKDELVTKQKRFVDYLNNHLNLCCKPPCINSSDKGLSFLGYVVYPCSIRLNKQSKNRFLRKYRYAEYMLTNGNWNQDEYIRHVVPLLAFIKKANTFSFRNKVIKNKETD